MTGSVAAGRDLHQKLHSRTTDTNTPLPKRSEKSISAGRALYDSRGRYAADTVELGATSTDV